MSEADPQIGSNDVRNLLASIAHTPIATVVTDWRQPDNPIVGINAAFTALTGYSENEAVGRNCRFLGGPGSEPEAKTAMRDAVAAGRAVMVELTNYRKDGSAFRNAVMIAPVLDSAGKVALFVGSQMDISDSPDGAGLRRSRARELLANLTQRQRQVLRLMTAGLRNKQIAGDLGIDEKTVKMHRARLIRALGVGASADAIRIAVEGDFETYDPA